MKSIVVFSLLAFCFCFNSYAQRDVNGVVGDTTKQTVPGAIVKLKSSVDSIIVTTDINGNFTFRNVKGKSFVLTIASIGYDALQRKYTLDDDNKHANLVTIVLKISSKMLGPVNIFDVN